VSWNLTQAIQHYSVCDEACQWLAKVGGFLQFPPPWYNWSIVESGIKHYKPNHKPVFNRCDNFFVKKSYKCSQTVLLLYILGLKPSQKFSEAQHGLVGFLESNTTFNNISVMSWQSVVLVEKTGGPGETHRPVTSHWQTWSHNVVLSTPRHEWDSMSQRKQW
jgi:hypothetical protein